MREQKRIALIEKGMRSECRAENRTGIAIWRHLEASANKTQTR